MLKELDIKPVKPVQREVAKSKREEPEDYMIDLSFTIHDPTIKGAEPLGLISLTVIDLEDARKKGIPLVYIFDADIALNYAYEIASRNVRSEKMLFLHTIEMNAKDEAPEVLASAIEKVLKKLGSPTTTAVISSKLPNTLAFYEPEQQAQLFDTLEFDIFKHEVDESQGSFTGETYWRTVDIDKMGEVSAPIINLGKDSDDMFGVNINLRRNTVMGEDSTSFRDGDLPLYVEIIYTPDIDSLEDDDDIEIEDKEIVIGYIDCQRYNIHTLLDMPKAKHIVTNEDIAGCVAFEEGEKLLASILDDTTREKVASHFAMRDISEIIYINDVMLQSEFMGIGAGIAGINFLMTLIGTSRSLIAINPTPAQYILGDLTFNKKGGEAVNRDVEKLQSHFKKHGFVDVGDITGQPIESDDVEGSHLLIRPAFINIVDN